MTLNLSIKEFIKNKSMKHTRQKKLDLNFDEFFFLITYCTVRVLYTLIGGFNFGGHPISHFTFN